VRERASWRASEAKRVAARQASLLGELAGRWESERAGSLSPPARADACLERAELAGGWVRRASREVGRGASRPVGVELVPALTNERAGRWVSSDASEQSGRTGSEQAGGCRAGTCLEQSSEQAVTRVCLPSEQAGG
jgi:hypothetical protein